MKRSDVAAISVGTVTALLIGAAASILCPLAGLVAGAYFSATAAAAAGMGVYAVWALGAAGAVGGLALGKIVKPLAVWCAIGIGLVTGALVKFVGAGFGFLSRAFKKSKSPTAETAPEKRGGIFVKFKNIFKLKDRFGAVADKGAKNTASSPAPNNEPPLKPAL